MHQKEPFRTNYDQKNWQTSSIVQPISLVGTVLLIKPVHKQKNAKPVKILA
jgi:hypothetical protein